MARIIYCITGETMREVKNLGWLLRNWRKITRFDVRDSKDMHYDAELIAYTDENTAFITDFASESILREFLFIRHKSIFDGLTVSWYGTIERI